MNKFEIEQSLCRSINQAPALDFKKLAAMPVIPMSEDDYITRQVEVPKSRSLKMPRYFRQLSAAFAGCMVILACIGTWFIQFKTPDSIIALDADQSVQIVTNKQKQILSVKAFDKETQYLLDQQDFNENNLEESVNTIVTAMIANGYLDDKQGVILVSVKNQSIGSASDLASSLDQVIKDSASNQNVTPTVLRSAVSDSESMTLAEQYNVSTGKIQIMKEIASADETLTMDVLATMTVAQLIQVSEEKSIDLTGIIESDQKDTQIENKDNKNNNPSSEVTNDEVIPAPSGNVTEDPVKTPDVPVSENPTKENAENQEQTPVTEPTDQQKPDTDSNGIVTPPAGSETMVPPDSSGNITPPVGEEKEDSLTEDTDHNQTEVVSETPQVIKTIKKDQDTPVPITNEALID
ncbi:MAG: hypothetical protein BI182_11835 [Acetobacterium sp. MES1]|uniref:anti-sigma-I factor RsgI family protein n=1 Tax=Acetobacterium sp. MES1 TaxID=1899015 RepID=UPI000B9D421C|nr:hypothetical protein [Acetobacterium sp. MES1]OXS24852.1 MAG: hypothetical protein BI182_11835 [Acetobacterium sp. MES1]